MLSLILNQLLTQIFNDFVAPMSLQTGFSPQTVSNTWYTPTHIYSHTAKPFWFVIQSNYRTKNFNRRANLVFIVGRNVATCTKNVMKCDR